jgi:PAS domain S-box-containing protein
MRTQRQVFGRAADGLNVAYASQLEDFRPSPHERHARANMPEEAPSALGVRLGAERALAHVAEEQAFSSAMVEAMPGIVYLYDEHGRFLRWNQNFEIVSGYSGAEIAGMHPRQFFRAEDESTLMERIGEAFTRGESSLEAAFVSKDGRATPYFFSGKRIRFEGAACLVGLGIDLTERKRAEAALARSEDRYRRTLDSIMEGCQLLDFDWRYLYLNDAAEAQNRRPNHELLGERMPDAWPGIEATPLFAVLRRCMTDRVGLHDEVEFKFPDGASGWFDVRTQPVREGVFVLSIDITQRKRAELALRELNESLERKIAERTEDLQVARERAESADRLKSAFLATMSHELRTPLNSILGFTGIILQRLAGPLTDEQDKQLGMVRTSARHLLALINDVLDISKIEAGQFQVRLEPFELAESVECVTTTVRPALDKKGLVLNISLPVDLPPIHSDRRRVDQILLNLLNNAIKFTDRGSVALSAAVVTDVEAFARPSPAPGALEIRVVDTGIGMKEEDLGKLFQPFSQLDSGLARQHEGSGLGLAICRRLTELLGGVIKVESLVGQGSTFTVTLPLRPLE